MDEGGRSHFVVEVEDLGHRITILRETIMNLHQTLETKSAEISNNNNILGNSRQVLHDTENALIIRTPSDEELLSNPELAYQQITALRSQLTSLSKVESNLTGLKPDTLDSCSSLVPYNQSSEIVSTLQIWQNVFEDTLGRYHRLSSLLASQHAKEMALKVWENQIDQAASSLSTPLSSSYEEIGEQMSLGDIHRTLLMHNQQQLMVRQPSPHAVAVQKLTKKNHNILEKIDNRNGILRNRQILWDTYTLDMNKLTSWIREMEKEKQMLNLKHVALIRLPKLLRKIQSLLEKIPTGEKLFKQLSSVQSDLKTSFNSSVLHSVKSELHNRQVTTFFFLPYLIITFNYISNSLSGKTLKSQSRPANLERPPKKTGAALN